MKNLAEISEFSEAVAEIIKSYDEFVNLNEEATNHYAQMQKLIAKALELDKSNFALSQEIQKHASQAAASAKLASSEALIITELKNEAALISQRVQNALLDFNAKLKEQASNNNKFGEFKADLNKQKDDLDALLAEFNGKLLRYENLINTNLKTLEAQISQALELKSTFESVQESTKTDKEACAKYKNEAQKIYEAIIELRKRSQCLMQKAQSIINKLNKIFEDLQKLIEALKNINITLNQSLEKSESIAKDINASILSLAEIKELLILVLEASKKFKLTPAEMKEYLKYLKELSIKIDNADETLTDMQKLKLSILENAEQNALNSSLITACIQKQKELEKQIKQLKGEKNANH